MRFQTGNVNTNTTTAITTNNAPPATTTTTTSLEHNKSNNFKSKKQQQHHNNNNNKFNMFTKHKRPATLAATSATPQSANIKATFKLRGNTNSACTTKTNSNKSSSSTQSSKKSQTPVKQGLNPVSTTSTTTTTSTNNGLDKKNNNIVNNNDDDDNDIETTDVEMRKTWSHFRTHNTLRSHSTSAILANGSTGSCGNGGNSNGSITVYARPRTLNVHNARQTPTQQTQTFFGELLNAFRAKQRCNEVPPEHTRELFQELSYHLSHKETSEMLQTAKKNSGKAGGLTFGHFCVYAAELNRFRTSTFSNASKYCDVKYKQQNESISSLQHPNDDSQQKTTQKQKQKQNNDNITTTANSNTSNNSSTSTSNSSSSYSNKPSTSSNTSNTYGLELRSTKSFSSVQDSKNKLNHPRKTSSEPVEVFLGGSCNPTTWRADVAIPALKQLGISFYNPQVSDWTPDLIELEHRAKEKARVLFFVMDSETRASAGAIEAAHIAGQNCKQLVLVLHPYKPQQKILNEPISQQEYIDLLRNQLILRELVTRRGLPVLDNIQLGLQRTKEILSGIRDPPSKISTILDVVRGAFDRVNPTNEQLTVEQCQRALSFLGYAQSLLHLDNLNKIIINQRESLKLLYASTKDNRNSNKCKMNSTTIDGIDFELFCVIWAYLSVLQQEIHESGCVSPIKGTNGPPPQVYFTNDFNGPDVDIFISSIKNISRTSSNASVPSNTSSGIGSDIERPNVYELLSRSRDSGTSSPQPQLETTKLRLKTQLTAAGIVHQQPQILLNVESIETTEIITTKTIETNISKNSGGNSTPTTPIISTATLTRAHTPTISSSAVDHSAGEESDSNDSVFSSNSSINSVTNNYMATANNSFTDTTCYNCIDLRDVYLGGSCVLRTNWRQELAIPYFTSHGITFHMPALHESIQQNYDGATTSQSTINATATTQANDVEQQQRSFVLTRRKCRGTQLQLEEQEELTVNEESWSWSSPPFGARSSLYNPALLDSSRVLLFIITNETRSLAPMTLAAHCIGLMYNVVLAVQMLPEDCVIGNEKLTPAAIKDYNRGRSYLIDLAKRQGVPVFNEIQPALKYTVAKIQASNNRNRTD